jgi:hypothetical protein
MNGKHEPEAELGEKTADPVRRPWHPPQFSVADFGLTSASNHGGTDGNGTPPSSS